MFRDSPDIRLRSLAGRPGCELNIAGLWALVQIYRSNQVLGSARLSIIAERLRIPPEVLEPTFDRLVDTGYALQARDQYWLTQAGVRQVNNASTAIVGRIVDKLAKSPNFEGRPDRVDVEAALERIAHRMLAQRDWDEDRQLIAATPRPTENSNVFQITVLRRTIAR